jgi:hypothetical protein
MSRNQSKTRLLLGGLLAVQSTLVCADPTASDLNHGSGVEVDSLNNVSTFSWWGISGETYFIQVTPDLTAGWEYIDYIYPGADDVLAHGFAVNTGAFFYRLKYTDQPTSDPWNDDFDGDNIGNQDELYQDTDPFAFDDANANGIPDDWETFWDDQFAVFPKPIEVILTHGESATKTLYLNNPVAPDADFNITVTGNEADFQGLYAWEDSLSGSATYTWTEISVTGTLLPLVSEIDNDSEKITLTQFEFPHYGRKYIDIWVASDGYLTLKEEYNDLSNETLPDTSFPDGLIAAFWDDLDTDDSNSNDSGTIYYQEFADRLIVQYEAVTQDANAFTNTFQVVLHADGTIEFFYKELNGDLDTVTVGMHNFDQTQAVQVAYNEPYLQNLLAVRFTQSPAYFVEVSPLSGTVTQGGFSSLAVDFETFELEPGTYQADIEIDHTGTGTTPWRVPAILELTNPPSQIELSAPVDEFTIWGDESVTLSAIATDDDFGIERVEFFADEAKQGEDLTGSYYSYYWQQPTTGVYSVTARAVDRLDTVTISEAITVIVLEDADLDRMEDGWETTNFLGLQEGPLDDFDQDGASNLHEYEAGTDPTDDTDTPENIPSVIAFTDPVDGATYLEGDDINFYASFSDADFGAERMVFYADGVEFYTDNSVYSNAYGFWDNPAPGTYTITAIATDRYGASTSVGTPITVTILEDSDGDRMPDIWETATFGGLTEEASEDFDLDGFPNIIEYHHGSDGNDPASGPLFATAQSAISPLAEIGEVRYYRVDGASNTSFEKSTISTAISAADDFDVIEVLPGIYDESINLNDRIYLFSSAGARSTIIDGGARNDNVVYIGTEAVIEGFTIRNGARSSDGAGLYISESTIFDQMRIVGCVIRDNFAGDQGGGVYVSNGRPTFVSCTIAGNEAASGGAIYNTSTSNVITLVNTLLWNPDAPEEIAGQTASIVWDHSLSRDTTSGNVMIDGADQLTADPGLGYAYSLVAASPARDEGTNALYPALDLDGEALTDGLKDIGADEFNDTDADGLPDWVEALGATDPTADADGDTLNNLDEYETHWTNPNDSDTDNDQLDDGAELTAGTDALDPDTDGDTLPDGWEVNNALDPLVSTDAQDDSDADGYTNIEEYQNNLDPQFAEDSDGDGIPDGIERNLIYRTATGAWGFLNLNAADTLGNGVPDGQEDFDNDGLTILEELTLGTDPNRSDTDADGVNDSVEVNLGTDPLTNNDFANQDSDGDGLTDLFEINYGTDPYDADTNDNGMNDGEELDNGGDPINPGPPPEPLDPGDPPGPDPFQPPPPSISPGNYDILIESKSISFSKRGHSTFQSTDPAKRYLTLSAQQSFSGGNPESGPEGESGSKSIEIDPITGESTTTGDSFVNTGGTPDSPVRRSGESQRTSYDDPPNQENDKDATINYSSVLSNENTTSMMVTNGKSELEDYENDFTTSSATPSAYRNVHANELRYDYQKVQFKFKWDNGVDPEARYPIRYQVLFIPEDDPDTPENEEETGLEIVDTIEWDGMNDESPVEEIDPDSLKPGEDGRYQLLKMDMAVDADRSGTEFDPGIQFGGTDQTSEDEPYYFWVNNDNDSGSDDEAEDLEPTSGHDYLDGQIDSARDLEDFSRLWINVDGIADQLKDGSLRLGLEWKNVSEGDPAIRLYDAVEVDGGMKYLFDENVANQQKSTAPPSPYAAIAMEESAADGRIFFPEDFWDDLPADGIVHFLFEATSPGKGELVFSLQANTAGLPQDIDMSMSGVWFDLKDIKKMYQHFTVATPDNSFMGEEEINPALVATEINGVGEAELDEMLLEDHYILFVHGWRMKAWERRGFAETAFKRLYWQGYKGRFGMFSWPTEWIPRLWWLADTPDISEPRNFSKSERKGMLSANGLRGVLTTLSGQYSSSKVHMFGHSLGNVVCSEALRLEYESNGAGDLINSYIACQSATAAHWYDGVGPELIETDESTTTPEVYRNYPIENQPYFSNIDSAAGTTVNFHNHQDNAMVGWLLGQDLKRIDPFWYYDEDDSRWYRNDSLIGGIVGIPDTALFFPADRYEIFAHIAEARSTSLGAAVYGQFSVAGSIDDEFDLNSDFSTTALNYGNAQEDHSAQFRSTNMRRSEFYRTLLDFMGL